jgi:hypothetical protein
LALCQSFIALQSVRALVDPNVGLNEFQKWIEKLVDSRYGTAQRLATALGISLSAFSRGVKAGSLSVESLLRLAVETGEPPSEILRRANKADVAKLIEQLYGPERASGPVLGNLNEHYSHRLSKLNVDDRRLLEELIESFERHAPKRKKVERKTA